MRVVRIDRSERAVDGAGREGEQADVIADLRALLQSADQIG